MNTKKTVFFREYFLYKFKRFHGLTVAAAIMNLFSAALPGILLLTIFNVYYEINSNNLSYDSGFATMLIGGGLLMAAVWVIAAIAVILTIVPAMSFKFYNNRASMDTIGCLPLTYRERFWGDFLGGLCPYLVSFIPSAVIGIIFTAVGQNGPLRRLHTLLMNTSFDNYYLVESINDDFVGVYVSIMLMVLLGHLGAYITASFVTSCCGKTGSSIVYSFVALIVPVGITAAFGTCLLGSAEGVVTSTEIPKAMAVFPPVGTWLSFISQTLDLNFLSSSSFNFMTQDPWILIAALGVMGAFLAGAYFLGKNRRAERVDRDFVYSAVYHVITCAMAVSVIGFYFFVKQYYLSLSEFILCFVIVFIFYAVVELAHTRSIWKIWQTVLRFAVIYELCIGFIFLAAGTHGLGIAKYLPARANIAEVSVSGQYFYSSWENGEEKKLVYNSDEAISVILEEHKTLLGHLDEMHTGGTLRITYKLKTGSEFTRAYSMWNSGADDDNDPLKQASDRIKELQPADMNALGFVSDPVYDDISICFDYYKDEFVTKFVSESKTAEFLELLRGDIINHYGEGEYCGRLTIRYTVNGISNVADYELSDGYVNVIEFLNKSENTTLQSPDIPDGEHSLRYTVLYLGWGDAPLERLRLSFDADDSSENIKEFIGYITTVDSGDDFEDYSEDFFVYIENSTASLYIRREDEEAALRALLRYVREKISAE